MMKLSSGDLIAVVLITFGVTLAQADAQTFLLSLLAQEDSVSNAKDLLLFEDGPAETTPDPVTSDNSTTTRRPLREIPQSTMDIITVVWYVSTFLALAAFFFLMACSDRRCNRNLRNAQPENPIPPPTPSPSYSEFAPPSYETVVKQYPQLFVVPVHMKVAAPRDDIHFHTVDELQKVATT